MKILTKILKFLLKNWIPVAFAVLIFVLLTDKSCDESAFKEDIAQLDKEITEIEKKNVVLEDEVFERIENAKADAKVVEELKAEVAESKLRIKELKKEEVKIYESVMALPASELVEDIRRILECAEVELTDNGILLSEVCARLNLVKLKGFSLVKQQLDETVFALSKSEDALHFSERQSWHLYGALWKLGSVVLNLKVIVKKKDQKYERSEKQRKKSYFKGIVLGITIGTGITLTIVLAMSLIRWIF